MFIPNPLRCFNCQKFGRGKNSCNRPAICAKCSQQGHLDTDCKEESHCANCSGPHPAFSKECPEWIKQQEIMKSKQSVVHHSVRPNSCMNNSFKAAVLPALRRLDGLALVMQRLLKRHVACLRRPNSHGQLIVQHLLK
jgi:hypothetical protein